MGAPQGPGAGSRVQCSETRKFVSGGAWDRRPDPGGVQGRWSHQTTVTGQRQEHGRQSISSAPGCPPPPSSPGHIYLCLCNPRVLTCIKTYWQWSLAALVSAGLQTVCVCVQ